MVFDLPVSRFFAMINAIPKIQAEEDLRRLMTSAYGANPGEKGKEFENYSKHLRAQIEGKASQGSSSKTLIPGITPGVSEAENDIESERRRKLEEIKRKEREWKDSKPSTT